MKTMLYEFITPSDPITFRASNNSIAFVVSVALGQGKAGCQNQDTGENVDSLTAFFPEEVREEIYRRYCGDDAQSFVIEHAQEIADAYKSFAYGSVSERRTHDAAIAAITDPKKLEEFKTVHEDQNRTSLSRWVDFAWKQGEALQRKIDSEKQVQPNKNNQL